MIIASRGDVTLLANLYAFGVIWSFVLNGIAVLVLRYTQPAGREFKVPLNFRIGGTEIPVGVASITLVLLSIARSEFIHEARGDDRRRDFLGAVISWVRFLREKNSKEPRTRPCGTRSVQSCAGSGPDVGKRGVKPGNILVPVSTYYALYPLEAALRRAKKREAEIVVLHVRMLRRARQANTTWRRSSFSARSSNCCSPKCWRWRRRKASR